MFLDSAVEMSVAVALSMVICGLLGWRDGNRFFHSLDKWIRWLQ